MNSSPRCNRREGEAPWGRVFAFASLPAKDFLLYVRHWDTSTRGAVGSVVYRRGIVVSLFALSVCGLMRHPRRFLIVSQFSKLLKRQLPPVLVNEIPKCYLAFLP